jgi:hypothetical protein
MKWIKDKDNSVNLKLRADSESESRFINTSSHVSKLELSEKFGGFLYEFVQNLAIHLLPGKAIVSGTGYKDNRDLEYFQYEKDKKDMEFSNLPPEGSHHLEVGENFIKLDGNLIDCEEVKITLETANFVKVDLIGVGISKLKVDIEGLK